MGAAFISQQYLQNVLGYSTLDAGAAILPAVVFMVLVAPRSAKLVEARGARFTLLCGYVFLLLAFATMLLLWKEDTPYWQVATRLRVHRDRRRASPARRPRTRSPARCPSGAPGMASGTADLQRDLGGAIMQSIFGALLTAGYATRRGRGDRAARRTATRSRRASQNAAHEVVLQRRGRRRSSTRSTRARSSPAAKQSFLDGDQWAYTAGLVAVLLGAALVFFMFPKKDEEERLLAEYHAEDTRAREPASAAPGEAASPPRLTNAKGPAVAGPRRCARSRGRQLCGSILWRLCRNMRSSRSFVPWPFVRTVIRTR